MRARRWASASARRTRWSTPAPANSIINAVSYSTTTKRVRAPRTGRRSVVILGQAVRIGSGREASSTTAAFALPLALREQGYETIMINSNPRPCRTDFDISDKLYSSR